MHIVLLTNTLCAFASHCCASLSCQLWTPPRTPVRRWNAAATRSASPRVTRGPCVSIARNWSRGGCNLSGRVTKLFQVVPPDLTECLPRGLMYPSPCCWTVDRLSHGVLLTASVCQPVLWAAFQSTIDYTPVTVPEKIQSEGWCHSN